VKLLVEKGAELDSKSGNRQPPLSWAAWNGHETAVKLLIEKALELGSKDKKFGWTPLSWAAWSRHEAVVKPLLEKSGELESKEDKFVSNAAMVGCGQWV